MNKLQKADEEYYITCGYLLKLASKAGELFESSEPDEKREILKLLLRNCTLDGTSVCYDLKKPFDTLLNVGSRHIWLGTEDIFRHKRLDLDFSLAELQTVFSRFNIPVPVFTSA